MFSRNVPNPRSENKLVNLKRIQHSNSAFLSNGQTTIMIFLWKSLLAMDNLDFCSCRMIWFCNDDQTTMMLSRWMLLCLVARKNHSYVILGNNRTILNRINKQTNKLEL